MTAARAMRSSAGVMEVTSYPMSASAVSTSATDGCPPGAPNTTRTSAATAKPRKSPPSTSEGKPAPRYSAASDTSTITRARIRRNGRTMNGAMPKARAVMAATFATG